MPEEAKVQPAAGQGAAPDNSGLLVSLLIWVAVGLIVGLVAYGLLYPKSVVQPPPVIQNITPPVTPPPEKNSTIIPLQDVHVTLIAEEACPSCNSSLYLLSQIAAAGPQLKLNVVNVSFVNSTSAEGQALISKYSLTKLPGLIISKEAGSSAAFKSAWASIGTQESDGAFVYRDVYPPYYDIANKSIVGIVGIVEIPAPTCQDCFNMSQFISFLSSDKVAMVFGNQTMLDANSTKAKELMSKYNITRLPAFLMSPDARAYTYVGQTWDQFGSVESDGWYVYRGVFPPYSDLTKGGAVFGRVSMVELVDPTCAECYNVSVYRKMFAQSLAMVLANITTYDITSAEGAKLVSKYKIAVVPTVILSKEALLYPGLNQSWATMGTIESDGWLVLRSIGGHGLTYKNLTSGNVTTG
jgi:hypothetical protein